MMTKMEKDVLFFISRVRCATDEQIRKVYNSRRNYTRKGFNKTLRRMCNEYTLKKFKCHISGSTFEDTYVYYLNGSNIFLGDELYKSLLGTEMTIKLRSAGYQINRFYRNTKIGDKNYDIYMLYTDRNGDLKQVLCDIYIDEEDFEDIDFFKYRNINNSIEKSTIPFFEVPKILIFSSNKLCKLSEKYFSRDFLNIEFIDLNFNKLFKYI